MTNEERVLPDVRRATLGGAGVRRPGWVAQGWKKYVTTRGSMYREYAGRGF